MPPCPSTHTIWPHAIPADTTPIVDPHHPATCRPGRCYPTHQPTSFGDIPPQQMAPCPWTHTIWPHTAPADTAPRTYPHHPTTRHLRLTFTSAYRAHVLNRFTTQVFFLRQRNPSALSQTDTLVATRTEGNNKVVPAAVATRHWRGGGGMAVSRRLPQLCCIFTGR